MNEKNTLQYIIDTVAQFTGESKKVAEQFSKAFFDTIVEALYMGESSVKIKGLGTFKLVEVDSRESVNVANGQRIVIPSYKKVTFVPDDEITDKLSNLRGLHSGIGNSQQSVCKACDASGGAGISETVASETGIEGGGMADVRTADVQDVEATDEDSPIDELITPEEVGLVERLDNPLSGIDLLISTPESINDVKSQYEIAKAKADEAIAAAKHANTEMRRLEKMLERLEANLPIGEIAQPDDSADSQIADAETIAVVETIDEPEAVSQPDPEPELETIPRETAQKTDSIAEANPTSSSDTGETSENGTTTSSAKDFALPVPAITPSEKHRLQVEQKVRKNRRIAAAIACILLVVGGVRLFQQQMARNNESVVEAPVIETEPEPTIKPAPVSIIDSATLAAIDSILRLNDSIMAIPDTMTVDTSEQEGEETQEVERTIPEYCTLHKGESLSRISQRYYGTKDSVPAIIRLNRFKDPNKIPIGARIYLP